MMKKTTRMTNPSKFTCCRRSTRSNNVSCRQSAGHVIRQQQQLSDQHETIAAHVHDIGSMSVGRSVRVISRRHSLKSDESMCCCCGSILCCRLAFRSTCFDAREQQRELSLLFSMVDVDGTLFLLIIVDTLHVVAWLTIDKVRSDLSFVIITISESTTRTRPSIEFQFSFLRVSRRDDYVECSQIVLYFLIGLIREKRRPRAS
jgi:hypothetical protein